jgi:hypothetical protein
VIALLGDVLDVLAANEPILQRTFREVDAREIGQREVVEIDGLGELRQ